MLFVTTCSKRGWDEYGKRLFESFDNAPSNARLVWYTEGFDIPSHPRIEGVPLTKIQGLQTFLNRHAQYEPVSWRWDVCKFSNKVFAACDALFEHKGLGIWIDADCVIHKKIPDGELEQFIPEGFYMSMFKRAGMYTETGFWMMDCNHPNHQAFIQAWLDWYESDRFSDLSEWHDCKTLDATVRSFEKAGLIETLSLSGRFEKEMHPMSFSPLGQWFDHCKGPRKQLGYSPENKQREAA